MPSDLKRVLITAALAAAAFNATAPAKRVHDMPGATPGIAAAAGTAPAFILAEHRPSRIRIGRDEANDGIRWTGLTEI